MRFRAWGPWQAFMLTVPLGIALGVWIGPVVEFTVQTVVTAMLVCVASLYTAWRYWQARQRLGREHVAFIDAFCVNVFCADETARTRWNFGVQGAIVRALRDVEERTAFASLALGFDIRIVSSPFSHRGLPGLNVGAWDPNRSTVTLAWFPGEEAPRAMHHEFAHVVCSRSLGLDGDAAHPRIAAWGW